MKALFRCRWAAPILGFALILALYSKLIPASAKFSQSKIVNPDQSINSTKLTDLISYQPRESTRERTSSEDDQSELRPSHKKIEREKQGDLQPREAAEFFLQKRLPAGETQLPVELYFEAQQKMQRMPRYSTAINRVLPAPTVKAAQIDAELAAWESLGPGNFGGRTRALLIDPSNPNVIYVAGVAGGVWKTTNGGVSWTPLVFPTTIAVVLRVKEGSRQEVDRKHKTASCFPPPASDFPRS